MRKIIQKKAKRKKKRQINPNMSCITINFLLKKRKHLGLMLFKEKPKPSLSRRKTDPEGTLG